jgi:hypothetical protein
MNTGHDLSFEEWASLARLDPQAFEAQRREVIGAFLRASGSQKTMGEALQREIDAVRNRAATPQDALLAIGSMLHAHLSFLGEELGALHDNLGIIENASRRVRAALAPRSLSRR